MIGVVRAHRLQKLIFVRGLLIESYMNSEIFIGIWREINYCNRCAHHPNYQLTLSCQAANPFFLHFFVLFFCRVALLE